LEMKEGPSLFLRPAVGNIGQLTKVRPSKNTWGMTTIF